MSSEVRGWKICRLCGFSDFSREPISSKHVLILRILLYFIMNDQDLRSQRIIKASLHFAGEKMKDQGAVISQGRTAS